VLSRRWSEDTKVGRHPGGRRGADLAIVRDTLGACLNCDDQPLSARPAGEVQRRLPRALKVDRSTGGWDVLGLTIPLDNLKPDNPIIRNVGFASGRLPSVPANRVLIKNCSIVGVDYGTEMDGPPALRARLTEVFSWCTERRLKPHISRRLPLDDAGAALRLLAARAAHGKIALEM